MRTLNTLLGEVKITDARIKRSHTGFGHYKIHIDFILENEQVSITHLTTDSELFDKANGEENHSEIVLKGAESAIDTAIYHYIDSL